MGMTPLYIFRLLFMDLPISNLVECIDPSFGKLIDLHLIAEISQWFMRFRE